MQLDRTAKQRKDHLDNHAMSPTGARPAKVDVMQSVRGQGEEGVPCHHPMIARQREA